jgi:hypothetical protein
MDARDQLQENYMNTPTPTHTPIIRNLFHFYFLKIFHTKALIYIYYLPLITVGKASFLWGSRNIGLIDSILIQSPHPCQNSRVEFIRLYEGKNMRTPWGTTRIILMMDWPKDVKYFGSDLHLKDEFSLVPSGPLFTTPHHT